MKLILTVFVTLLSVISLADVARSGVKPGPVGSLGPMHVMPRFMVHLLRKSPI